MKIMKSVVKELENEIIDDIRYILYLGTIEDIGIIHIIDLDTNENIELIKYPSVVKATAAYNKMI